LYAATGRLNALSCCGSVSAG